MLQTPDFNVCFCYSQRLRPAFDSETATFASQTKTEKRNELETTISILFTDDNGDYYFWVANKNYSQGFPTSMVTDCEIPTQPIELEQGLGAEGTANVFTVSVQTKMPTTASKYLGNFFATNRLSIDVVSGYLLQLTLDGQTYNGSGRFLATDHYYRGVTAVTDQSAALLPKATLTLTYDGQRLTLYRNELVDMQFDIEGLNLGDIQAGTYANFQLRTWSRVLNNDEVRQLVSTDFSMLTSGIREVQSSVNGTQEYYNLSGQLLSRLYWNLCG